MFVNIILDSADEPPPDVLPYEVRRPPAPPPPALVRPPLAPPATTNHSAVSLAP